MFETLKEKFFPNFCEFLRQQTDIDLTERENFIQKLSSLTSQEALILLLNSQETNETDGFPIVEFFKRSLVRYLESFKKKVERSRDQGVKEIWMSHCERILAAISVVKFPGPRELSIQALENRYQDYEAAHLFQGLWRHRCNQFNITGETISFDYFLNQIGGILEIISGYSLENPEQKELLELLKALLITGYYHEAYIGTFLTYIEKTTALEISENFKICLEELKTQVKNKFPTVVKSIRTIDPRVSRNSQTTTTRILQKIRQRPVVVPEKTRDMQQPGRIIRRKPQNPITSRREEGGQENPFRRPPQSKLRTIQRIRRRPPNTERPVTQNVEKALELQIIEELERQLEFNKAEMEILKQKIANLQKRLAELGQEQIGESKQFLQDRLDSAQKSLQENQEREQKIEEQRKKLQEEIESEKRKLAQEQQQARKMIIIIKKRREALNQQGSKERQNTFKPQQIPITSKPKPVRGQRTGQPRPSRTVTKPINLGSIRTFRKPQRGGKRPGF